MTAENALRACLSEHGCRIEIDNEGVAIVGQTDRLTAELVGEARKLKPALLVELLREQAEALTASVEGDAPLAERQARLRELLAVEERLTRAQLELWASWRRDGFTILWSPLVEEFILAGGGPAPPGHEGLVVYSWDEVEAMKDASPEAVVRAHRVKKVS